MAQTRQRGWQLPKLGRLAFALPAAFCGGCTPAPAVTTAEAVIWAALVVLLALTILPVLSHLRRPRS
jgi:hypothetical protein